MSRPFWISPNDPNLAFPPVELALSDPNGLLAVGADLSPERIINAYHHGIFPWYSEDQPILWWSPDPRAVLYPDQLHISRSLRKTLRRNQFRITLDTQFEAVMLACAEPRPDGLGTWITDEMLTAYIKLHQMGVAHSVEAWLEGRLVGGLYGLALGRVFFGESMFSRAANASKVAFTQLVLQLRRWDFALIDCQVSSNHLSTLGAMDIPRNSFINQLSTLSRQSHPVTWQFDEDLSF